MRAMGHGEAPAQPDARWGTRSTSKLLVGNLKHIKNVGIQALPEFAVRLKNDQSIS